MELRRSRRDSVTIRTSPSVRFGNVGTASLVAGVPVGPSNGRAFSPLVPAVSATPEYKWSCRYYSRRRTRYCSRVTCGRASQAELDSQREAETRGNSLPLPSPLSALGLSESVGASGNVCDINALKPAIAPRHNSGDRTIMRRYAERTTPGDS